MANWYENSRGKLINLDYCYFIKIEKETHEIVAFIAGRQTELLIEYCSSQEEAEFYYDKIKAFITK